MAFEYNPLYGEKKYHIRYKDMFGNEHSVEGDADSKSEAERLFYRRFDNCEIIKVQTSEEWVEETAKNISDGLMKYIKSSFGNTEAVINPSHAKNINYKSKSFLKGLRKITEEAKRSSEMSIPNYEKKYLSYNI